MDDGTNPYASPTVTDSPSVQSVEVPWSGRLAHVPRLTIGYLLLATTVTAVMLPVVIYASRVPRQQTAAMLILMFLASFFGWICTAALLVAWYAIRGTLWRLEPGECLLLGLANVIILGLAAQITFPPLSLIVIFLPAESAIVYLRAAATQRRRTWWCAVLTCGAGLCLAPYAVMGRDLVSPPVFVGGMWLMSLTILVLITAGMVDDRLRRATRHWMHWSGIGISATLLLGLLVLMTMALFL